MPDPKLPAAIESGPRESKASGIYGHTLDLLRKAWP